MANTRRVPFVLNLDDPIDMAIWEKIEPMLSRRRASAWLRDAAAMRLGLVDYVSTPQLPAPAPMTSLDTPIRAKRPAALPSAIESDDALEVPTEDDPDDIDAAANNFLNMFG